MSYIKQTWETGDIITAEKLNNMEDGIAGGAGGVMNVTTTDDGAQLVMNKTFAEIKAAYLVGTTIICTMVFSTEYGTETTNALVTGVYEYENNGQTDARKVHVTQNVVTEFTADSDDGYPYWYYD